VLLLSVSLVACLILFFMPVLLWLKALAILLISLTTIWHMAQNALLLLPKSIIKLELTARAEFFVTQRDGQKIKAEVLTTSFVAWYLVMLNLRLPDGRLARHVVLMPDMLDGEAFRRLRVWLRWGHPASTLEGN
jgi:toxin CptA